MKINSNLRKLAKSTPPLFWLAGLARYIKFRVDLRKANIEYQEVQQKTLPPPMLRYRVHKALDEHTYNQNGDYLSSVIAEQINNFFGTSSALKILDFACGPGRVIVKLKEKIKNANIYGSDIDQEAITWAETNLSQIGVFSVNDPHPPSPFLDSSFDVVYSISLFTHLDEKYQNEWLFDISRIIKPGGILIATTHGALSTAACTPEELKQLNETGFVYRTDHKGKFKLDGLPDFYQTTFHTKEYVFRNWSKFFHIENYLEGGVNGHQDLVILRKV